jgi:hypothetical protein
MKNEDGILIQSTAIMLAKHFSDDKLEQAKTADELKENLTACIVYLLLNEMEKLLHILYRIDVNESKVKAVFAQQNPTAIAPALASLIIERELEKSKSRAEHRKAEE